MISASISNMSLKMGKEALTRRRVCQNASFIELPLLTSFNNDFLSPSTTINYLQQHATWAPKTLKTQLVVKQLMLHTCGEIFG